MKRLDFVLPDFTRVGWVSDAARDHWGPIVSQIVQDWSVVERETVYRGVRAAAITDCQPEQLSTLIVEAAERGCVAVPLEVTANGGYAASSRPPAPGEARKQRVAIVTGVEARAFKKAWQDGDHDTMGGLLGFPGCCRAHFQQVWVRDRRVDPTWQQAGHSDAHSEINIQGYHSEANVLGRWMGVRAVPHLPCSFTCEPTVAFAAAWKGVALELGYQASWDAIDQVTRWQTAWSALHGIAEIVTPVWRVIARTDATADRIQVHVHGDQVPVHAATGLTFPYPRVGETVSVPDPRAWTDNGFSSQDAMRRAHAVIVEAVKAWKPVPGSVLDLGCGNGVLVRKLATGKRGGVDLDPDRIHRARGMDPHGTYAITNLSDPVSWPAGEWGLTVCMVGRLLEGDTAAARQALRVGPVAFYAYSDWLGARSIEALIAEAGQGDRIVLQRRETAEAAVVVVC